MEQLYKLTPLALLCAFIIKLLISGATYASVGVVLALSALSAVQYALDKNSTVQEIKDIVTSQNKSIKDMGDHVDNMRTSVSSIKMSQGMSKKF